MATTTAIQTRSKVKEASIKRQKVLSSLLVNGVLTSGGGTVSVAGNATLGGTGTIHRAVALLDSATLSAGDNGVGESLGLFKAAQALAAIRGRGYVVPDDVKAMALPVLGHRIILRPESQLRGRTAQQVVTAVLDQTAVPVEAEAR
jgi:hypothetical protein